MPFLQIKHFFIISVSVNEFFQVIWAVSKVGSNLEMLKDMGKICSNVILFFIIGNSRDSVK